MLPFAASFYFLIRENVWFALMAALLAWAAVSPIAWLAWLQYRAARRSPMTSGGRPSAQKLMAYSLAAGRVSPSQESERLDYEHGIGVAARRRVGMLPYNAAKGAIVNLTRALAMDVGKNGIAPAPCVPA